MKHWYRFVRAMDRIEQGRRKVVKSVDARRSEDQTAVARGPKGRSGGKVFGDGAASPLPLPTNYDI